tara:strand:+ start:250 stop:489 length:240 start_codon:yes stop_codon:yes gene_type:complete
MKSARAIVSLCETSTEFFNDYVKIPPVFAAKMRQRRKTLYDSLGLFGYQQGAGSRPQDRGLAPLDDIALTPPPSSRIAT